jgi:membrane protease subunit HflK
MRSQFDDNGARPDVTEVVNQVSDVLKRNGRMIGPVLLLILVIIALVTGLYSVGPGEQGVVRTFGKVTATTGPGLHFAWPVIQRRNVVNVKQIERIEVGFRAEKKELDEARMLTGDENIVETQMIVQYRIADPIKFLFRLKDPGEALHATAEVALRTVVGQTKIDALLTEGRERVQAETATLLQELMDAYDSGLQIVEVKLQKVEPPEQVKDAFDDVVRAREEREKLINQAKGYAEDKQPRARGEAAKMEREAEAYEAERVQRARGDAERFESQLREYTKAKRVTRERLYLETMERILGQVEKKIIVDDDVSRSALPILPLGPDAAAAAVGGGK